LYPGILRYLCDMKTSYIITLTLSLLASAGIAADTAGKYVIQTESPRQTIRHFGASDAWSMQFLGLWPESEQRQIADWLFSMETNADGQPKGIGLSVWRFNLGAGSEEQGDSSGINRGTRTECFLQADGSYNWNKQLGQRRFLALAKERGVEHFLAFLNSVPVHFTQNGLATNTGRGGTINLKPGSYAAVAKFLAEVMKGIERHDGIRFDYLCPVNEPDGSWNWQGPKQEGSPATNREIACLAKEIGRQFAKEKISTQILVNESSDLRCLTGTHNVGWQRGNTVSTFFSADSTATYLGQTPNVPRLILGHSYWTNTPLDFMRSIRMQLRDTLSKYRVGFWQTETCIMSNDKEIGGGGGYDFTMKTALYVARIIHHDLVYADAESWSWWRAAGGNYKDGLLRVFSSDGMKTGWVSDSKLLWSLGNYSRFVRPGAVRYSMSAVGRLDSSANGSDNNAGESDTDPTGIMCSAYKNADGTWAVVVINYSNTLRPFELVPGEYPTHWLMYRTSERPAENLAPAGSTSGTAMLPPRSITTFVSAR
jgi:O-glycosyl hydrolase